MQAITVFGATAKDWSHFSDILGSTADLLPVVSNPHARISPLSKMKQLGKTPSRYNNQGEVGGFKDWTSKITTWQDIANWQRQPDYGICLQTRHVRAFDIDVEDKQDALAILQFIGNRLGILPLRHRANSGKCLLAFAMPGDHFKSVIRTKSGAIEFLGTGQQFIAVGTHPSGERYRWAMGRTAGYPDKWPVVTPETFSKLWADLAARFGVGETISQRERHAPDIKRGIDMVVDFLAAQKLIIGRNRDGSFNINCPFESEHTTESVESATTYWPAHTGGYAQGHFKCLHAHCAGRSDGDFINRLGVIAASFDVVESTGSSLRDAETKEKPAVGDDSGLSRDFGTLQASKADAATTPAIAQDPTMRAISLGLERNKSGRPLATIDNVVRCLDDPIVSGCVIEYDTFRDTLLIRTKRGEAVARPFDKNDFTKLRIQLEKHRGFVPISPALMKDAVYEIASRNRVDSAEQWLTTLRWDGVPRVAGFMASYFKIEPGPYAEAVSRYLWTALAGRVMQPGCKADMAIVIIGEQGQRKSTGVAMLVPSYKQFVEIHLGKDEDTLARLMRGKLVGELGEMRGISRKEADEVKSWIARRHDTWVPKYEEIATEYGRRIVLLGTGNIPEFMDDETGARRWLPVTMVPGLIVDTDAIERDREQLWAEGLAMWLADGVQWQDAEDAARSEHHRYKVVDESEELVRRWLDAENLAGERNGDEPFALVDLMIGIGIKDVRRKGDQMQFARILRGLGYARQETRYGEKTAKRWKLHVR